MPDLANKNRGYLVKFEFQINSKELFRRNMFHVIFCLCYKIICENILAVSYRTERVTTL